MSVVVPEKFSMGVNPAPSILSTFNCFAKAFSEQGHNIVVIASGQYLFACGRNFIAPTVRV